MRSQSLLKLVYVLILMIAAGTVREAQSVQDQSVLVRHAQPDDGSITLAKDWVVASAAEDAAENTDGLVFQQLMSARVRRNGLPVVFRSWRLSSPEAGELLVQDTIDSIGAQGVVVRQLTPPPFRIPQGMRTKSRLVSYDMGGEFRAMFVTSSNDAVSHVIGITWAAAVDRDFAPELKQILESWVPSKRLVTRTGLARPELKPQTVTLASGDQVTTPTGWQVVSKEPDSGSFNSGGRSINVARILNLRRYPAGGGSTEILLLQKYEGVGLTLDDAAAVLDADIRATARFARASVQVQRRQLSSQVLELTAATLPDGVAPYARIERRGGALFAALCYASDRDQGIAAAKQLLSSLIVADTSEAAVADPVPAPAADPAPAPAARPASRSVARVISENAVSSLPTRMGAVMGVGLVVAVPVLIAGMFGRRAAAVVLSLSALFVVFVGYGGGMMAMFEHYFEREKLAELAGAEKRPLTSSELSWGAAITIVMTLFGETGVPQTDATIPELACAMLSGSGGAAKAGAGTIALGGMLSLIGPLLIRLAVQRRPFERRRTAYFASTAWFWVGLLALHALGSSSAPHYALMLGSLLLLVLMLPSRRATKPVEAAHPEIQTAAQTLAPPEASADR